MALTKLELTIQEFSHFLNSPPHEAVLDKILRTIVAQGIQVYLIPSWEASSHRQITVSQGFVYEINIGGKRPDSQRLEILFDLLHEFGHYLDPDKLTQANKHDEGFQRGREMRAWQLADQALEHYPELAHDRPAYEAYKRRCLLTYGISG